MSDKISYRVMKMQEFGSSVFYKVDCSCGDTDHIVTIELEKDDHQFINLNMTQNLVWSSYYCNSNIFQRILSRIRTAFKALVFGYVEGEGTLMLNGEEHIQSFINALEEGKLYVRDYRKENQDN